MLRGPRRARGRQGHHRARVTLRVCVRVRVRVRACVYYSHQERGKYVSAPNTSDTM